MYRIRKTQPARAGFLITVLVLAALLPTLVNEPVWQGIAVQVLISACGALGMTLLFGFAGQISLAQAAFFGIGSFAPAIIAVKYGGSPWWGLPVGVVSAAVLAAIVGAPVLRLEGLFLAMATTALNILMVIVAEQLPSLTGGPYGLAGLHPLELFGWSLVEPKNLYYLVLAAFLVLVVLTYRLINSPLGPMFAALRHNARAAALTGIPVPTLKTKTFALSAAFAAVGGFFLAEYLLIASPDSFSIVPSLYFLLMVVVGGSRSIPGAIIGAAFVTIVPQLLPGYSRLQEILFAVSFLVIVLFVPNGLAGVAISAWKIAHRAWTGAMQTRSVGSRSV